MNNNQYLPLQQLQKLGFKDEEILEIFATLGQSALAKTIMETCKPREEQEIKQTDLENMLAAPDDIKKFYSVYEKKLQEMLTDILKP
jgi:hypothetical protein